MLDKKYYGVDVIVDSFVNYDVKYVFGILGVKIDWVFECLEYLVNLKSLWLIVMWYEQNVVFIVVGIGWIIGKFGVVMIIFGFGVSNLVMGFVMVIVEGDLVLVIFG